MKMYCMGKNHRDVVEALLMILNTNKEEPLICRDFHNKFHNCGLKVFEIDIKIIGSVDE